jgi:hypothetical protein
MKLAPTTTNAQVLDNMMARLGNRQSPKLRGSVLFELNNKINLLEGGALLPWFLQKEWAFQLVVNQITYDLPADFLREEEEGALRVSYQGRPIAFVGKVAKEDLVYEGDDPALCYTLFGEKLQIAPTPDTTYDCVLEYLAASTDVTDTGVPVSNVWLLNAYNFVTYGALVAIANFHVQDPEMAARFEREEAKARDALWRTHEARQHTNRDYKIED